MFGSKFGESFSALRAAASLDLDWDLIGGIISMWSNHLLPNAFEQEYSVLTSGAGKSRSSFHLDIKHAYFLHMKDRLVIALESQDLHTLQVDALRVSGSEDALMAKLSSVISKWHLNVRALW